MKSAPQSGSRNIIRRIWGSLSFRGWLALAAVAGGVIGLSLFTFAYAEGASYLSDDPSSCVNCHIMREQYNGWNHGSHKAVATCNDCHTPHNSIIAKYAVKGLNGYRHSAAFTLDNFHEPIQITPLNREVARNSCLYCHERLTAEMNHAASDDPTDCLQCHAQVGHP